MTTIPAGFSESDRPRQTQLPASITPTPAWVSPLQQDAEQAEWIRAAVEPWRNGRDVQVAVDDILLPGEQLTDPAGPDRGEP
ncbi:MAG: hypothetical protein M3Y77_03585 [Actinomycetota bacterium]|nr:hypothetical protein [Actinomycetota bacterium]